MCPRIFTFHDLAVIGELSINTDLQRIEACSVCHRSETVYQHFSYKLDAWNGEDIITVALEYLISDRIKTHLEKHQIEGILYTPIMTEKSEHFEFGERAYSNELPKFYRIEIITKLHGPDIWWKKTKKCDACDVCAYRPTTIGIESTIASDTTEEYTPREVYKDSWHGEQIFLLQDPGPPIITAELVELIRQSSAQTFHLREANWV